MSVNFLFDCLNLSQDLVCLLGELFFVANESDFVRLKFIFDDFRDDILKVVNNFLYSHVDFHFLKSLSFFVNFLHDFQFFHYLVVP